MGTPDCVIEDGGFLGGIAGFGQGEREVISIRSRGLHGERRGDSKAQ
jgi:hypothetical protein